MRNKYLLKVQTMRNKQLLIVLFIPFLLASCDLLLAVHGDDVDLGGGYRFVNRAIGKVKGIDEYMSSFDEVIPTQVLNHSQDENYIVVYQVPDPEDMCIDSVRMSQHEMDSIRTLYQKMSEIVDCYWIIRIKDNTVWGPMDEQTYRRKHDELQIEVELDKSYENQYVGVPPQRDGGRDSLM